MGNRFTALRLLALCAPLVAGAQQAPQVPMTQPYFEFQVEKTVQQLPDSGRPVYPEMLRAAKVEGQVLAQFIVDEDGRYEAGSFKVLRSHHVLFTQAVKDALPNMRFLPAELGGKKVRQLVQRPFIFSLATP
jgi:protein TonB